MVEETETAAVALGVKTANVASFIALSKFFNLVVSGLSFVTVARLLGANNYGVYVLALGVAGLIGSFSNLNVGNYFAKHVPELLHRKQEDKLAAMLGDGLILIMFISIASTIAGILVSGAVASYVFHSSGSSLIIDVAMLGVLFIAAQGALGGALVGMSDAKGIALQTIIQVVVQAAVSIGLILLGVGPLGAVIGWVLGFAASTLSGLLLIVRRHRIAFVPASFFERSKTIVGFSAPLAFTAIIASLVNNGGIIYLGLLFLPAAVGAYGVGNKMGSFMDVVTGSVTIVITPMFAAAMANRRLRSKMSGLYSYSLYFGVLALAPMVLYFVLFANAFVVTVLASTYSNAAFYMALISVGVLLMFFWMYGNQMAIGLGDVKRYMKYNIIAMAVQVSSLFMLVPYLGAVGVILAMYFIGTFVADALYWNYIRKVVHLKLNINPMLRLIPANVALLVIFYLLSGIQTRPLYLLAAGVGVIAFVYPPLLAMTRGIDRNYLALARKIAGGIPGIGGIGILLLRYTEAFIR